MVAPSSNTSSLKDYLRKYDSGYEEEKKKKKKKKAKSNTTGVLIVDEDPVWEKPVNVDEEEDDSADDETPMINEDIEVKRMKRLEQLRAKRPFGAISEDGSGWVSVSDAPKNNLNSDDQNLDLSPPCKGICRNDSPSPELKLNPSRAVDVDLSPPHKRRARNDTPSPGRNSMQSRRQDEDLSPPRKHTARSDTPSSNAYGDISPPRRRSARYDTPSPERDLMHSEREDADLSPPRKDSTRSRSSFRKVHGDVSPPPLQTQRKSQFPANDLSPTRKRRARNDTPSPEPKSMQSRRQGEDLSPPRKRNARSDTPSSNTCGDVSPPRRRSARYGTSSPERDLMHSGREGADLSPPRKHSNISRSSSRKVHGDVSPTLQEQRKNQFSVNDDNTSDIDLSPPRKIRAQSPAAKQRPKTGLVSAKDVKDEIAKTKKEEWLRIKELDPSVSGKGAEGVYRDKVTGERVSKEEFLKSHKKKEKEKPKEIKLEWGKGLAQKREMEARLQELENEKNKPFARSRDDPDLDNMLKERLRWGDPMAHLVKKKQADQALLLPDLGSDDKMKESGFIIPQEIPPHSWIRRGLEAAPNRYGIKPGRHWDGVDRSNGYEKQMFKRSSEKQATEREAYLWSVADM
ncbi:unnamed protein product [Cuscuta campestris]|uniref:BUD13 homolog n=1 Tax=Cuscuta campestris TaxID=132261 RepID=A0A484MIK8_9ASTE|nr:unnamed protein product [Cuscuta campestris]